MALEELQKGIGEGTTKRKRREPRMRTEDVAIAEASGLTLGPDGYPHPLETTKEGELKVTERTLVSVMEDVLVELQRMRMGMVLQGTIVDVD